MNGKSRGGGTCSSSTTAKSYGSKGNRHTKASNNEGNLEKQICELNNRAAKLETDNALVDVGCVVLTLDGGLAEAKRDIKSTALKSLLFDAGFNESQFSQTKMINGKRQDHYLRED